MNLVRKVIQLAAVISFLYVNTAMGVGFVSRDVYNLIDADDEFIASMNCSSLPYETSIFMSKVSDRQRNVLIKELVVRSKSLTLKFDPQSSEVSEYTIDTTRLDCDLEN